MSSIFIRSHLGNPRVLTNELQHRSCCCQCDSIGDHWRRDDRAEREEQLGLNFRRNLTLHHFLSILVTLESRHAV